MQPSVSSHPLLRHFEGDDEAPSGGEFDWWSKIRPVLEIWTTLIKAAGSAAVRAVPGLILQQFYPVGVRRDRLSLHVASTGGPLIYGLYSGKPRITEARFIIANNLPFSLTVREIVWEVGVGDGLGSAVLARTTEKMNLLLPAKYYGCAEIEYLQLTNQEALDALKRRESDYVLISFHGVFTVDCAIGSFEKFLQASIYTPIHRPLPIDEVSRLSAQPNTRGVSERGAT
jgi:hypothetical protein